MAHFYGMLRGSRGETTRLGSKDSGLKTTAASWSGAVDVNLYVDSAGNDCAVVRLVKWHGRGVNRLLYSGPINQAEEVAA